MVAARLLRTKRSGGSGSHHQDQRNRPGHVDHAGQFEHVDHCRSCAVHWTFIQVRFDHMPVFTPSTPHLHILTFICSPNSLLYTTCASPVYLNGSPSCTMKNFMTGAFKWQNLETQCTLASTEARLVTTLCLFQRKRGRPKGL